MREDCRRKDLVDCPYRIYFYDCKATETYCKSNCDREDVTCDGCQFREKSNTVECSSNPCQFALEQELRKLTTELQILNTNKYENRI